MKTPPDDPEFLTVRPNPATRGLETFVMVLSGVSAVGVLGVAILIMLDIGSSEAQGGRYYVAVAAILVLGAIESQIAKMVQRRVKWSLLGPEPTYNRPYTMWSCLVMLVCGAVLIGLAYFLP